MPMEKTELLEKLHRIRAQVPAGAAGYPTNEALDNLIAVTDGSKNPTHNEEDAIIGAGKRELRLFAAKGNADAQAILDGLGIEREAPITIPTATAQPAKKPAVPQVGIDAKGRVLGPDGKPQRVKLRPEDNVFDRHGLAREKQHQEWLKKDRVIAGVTFGNDRLDALGTTLTGLQSELAGYLRPLPRETDRLKDVVSRGAAGMGRGTFFQILDNAEAELTRLPPAIEREYPTYCADALSAVGRYCADALRSIGALRADMRKEATTPHTQQRPANRAPIVYTIEPSAESVEKWRQKQREQGGDKGR